MTQFLQTESLVIILLFIAALVAMAVRRFRVPYTVALVLAGLVITSQSALRFTLTPELILALFVPPLVFEAAFHLNLRDLLRSLPAILLLAVPGVMLSTLIAGGILHFAAGLPLALALIFGALIAATDPVSIVALFRTLGAPKRLTVLVEGESLFNDGTAIVVFNLVLVYALTGRFDWAGSLADFLRVSSGGVLIGVTLGWVVSQLIARVDDYLIETTLTSVLAFGSYLLAEQFHFSGVQAVVAAGLVNGNIGPRGMSPTTRIVLNNFWEYVAFVANSLVFLLIGLQVNLWGLAAAWKEALWAVGAALAARAVVVYGLGWLVNRVSGPAPWSWLHVLNWSGLRGAISLALALSLPAALGGDRDLLLAMALAVVLFTLLVQSASMRLLIRKLRIVTRSEAQVEYELRHARLAALRTADARLDRLHAEGRLSTHSWEKLKQHVSAQAAALASALQHLLVTEPALEAEELDKGWRELQRSQRSALLGLRRDGAISDESYETLAAEVDARLSEGLAAAGGEITPVEGESAAQFVEVILPAGSQAVGKEVAALGVPRAAVLVSVRRGNEVIIPRGDTELHAGDAVTLLCEAQYVDEVRRLLLAPAEG